LRNSLVLYIDHLQKQNSGDLAFYPVSALEKALDKGHLLTCGDNGQPAGYLWHGPANTGRDIVIYQACVDYASRRRHLGLGMVSRLIGLGQSSGATGIRLRCGSSSESNEFWGLVGFYCTKVSEGGVKRGRKINHWRTDIQKPLFVLEGPEPSTQEVDQRAYRQMRKEGVPMPSRWASNVERPVSVK